MKIQDIVPSVYLKESRDFTYISKMLECIINYMKMNCDSMNFNLLSDTLSSNILELLASTVGFESKHKYINKDLIAIISSFNYLLKNKGSMLSLKKALQLLYTSQRIVEEAKIEKDKIDNKELLITVDNRLKDIVLFEDILDYILPAGMTVKIIYATYYNNKVSNQTLLYENSIKTVAQNIHQDLKNKPVMNILINKDDIKDTKIDPGVIDVKASNKIATDEQHPKGRRITYMNTLYKETEGQSKKEKSTKTNKK